MDLFSLDFSKAPPSLAVFFLFQVMLCVTSVTILSGIVAERMKFGAYLFVAVIVSGFSIPLRVIGVGPVADQRDQAGLQSWGLLISLDRQWFTALAAGLVSRLY